MKVKAAAETVDRLRSCNGHTNTGPEVPYFRWSFRWSSLSRSTISSLIHTKIRLFGSADCGKSVVAMVWF